MGNFVINLWWGGDPDMPDFFSGLTLRDVHNVQSTWSPVYAQAGTYGMQMFLRLFRKDPYTKTFFKAVRKLDDDQITKCYQFKAHVINLMSSINTCVENLKEPQIVAALMNKLGETHFEKHIEKIHFEEFKEIWTGVLVNLNLNEQVMVSWNKFIEFIYKHIYDTLNGDS